MADIVLINIEGLQDGRTVDVLGKDIINVSVFIPESMTLVEPEPWIPPPTHGQLWPRGVYPD